MADARLVTDLDAIHALIPAWRELIARSESATVFQTPEWALGWWRTRAKNSIPFCVALFERERMVGLAPLYLESKWGARTLRFMGTAFDDPKGALVETASANSFADAFANTLSMHASRWDILRLSEAAEQDMHLARACAQRLPELAVRQMSSNRVPVLNLPASWQVYWSNLSAQRRKALNKARRRLEARGALAFRVITDADSFARELKNFYAVRARNWQERRRWKRTVLLKPSQTFYDTQYAICVQLAAKGQIWLARLDLDERPIAWHVLFRVNETLADFMTTFDNSFAAYSPGHLVLQHVFQHAIAQGIKRVELGRGLKPYKAWFRATPQINNNLVLYWKRPRAFAYLGQQLAREEALKMINALRNG